MINKKPRKVSSIKFGNGGSSEIVEDRFPTHVSGYYSPENWEPLAWLDYPDGIPVIDARDFYRTTEGIEFSISGPMLTNKASVKINGSKQKNIPSYLQYVTIKKYIELMKKADVKNLVKYGHIENMSIVWEV